MAKGEFNMFMRWWGAMIFSFDKSTYLEGGGSEKKPQMIRKGFQKVKRKKRKSS